MSIETQIRDALGRQAQTYDVPPLDLKSLRAAAQRRRRNTLLRYGGMAAVVLLAGGAAWSQLDTDQASVQPADRRSDITISPSCFPAGEAPPVPRSPFAGAGFVADQPVPGAPTADGRSCTLVLRYWFHRFGPGPFVSGMVWLYSDGRLIVDTSTGKDWFVQRERRLTSAGVERLRTTVAEMLEASDSRSGRDFEPGVRYGDGIYYPKDTGALKRLLIDWSWLPDQHWVTESPSIYRAAWYLTCYEMPTRSVDTVWAAVRDLPAGARDVLESNTWTALPPEQLVRSPDTAPVTVRQQCMVLSHADATMLVEALGGDITRGRAIVIRSGLEGPARRFSVLALMPDGTSGAHGD